MVYFSFAGYFVILGIKYRKMILFSNGQFDKLLIFLEEFVNIYQFAVRPE